MNIEWRDCRKELPAEGSTVVIARRDWRNRGGMNIWLVTFYSSYDNPIFYSQDSQYAYGIDSIEAWCYPWQITETVSPKED